MRAILRKPALVAGFVMFLVATSVVPAAAYHLGSMEPHPFGNDAFRERWNRTDQPVIDGQARTWVWGPEPYTETMLEPYVDAPGGMRQVQYFDKSRMEVNNPSGDPDELWFVTNGLLVIDMVEGRYQIGDDEFDESPAPANIQIAGDPDSSPEVSYASINNLGLRDAAARPEGTLITQKISGGNIAEDDDLGDYGVTAQYRVQVDGIDHTVASVFWDFMTSEGVVYEDFQAIAAPLFPNPFYATGYPITEAYWATVMVEGFPQDVLWQCFERRCLTYTPSNEPGWRVEAGNVGQHYFQWRYGQQGPAMETVELAFVAIGDNGNLGPAFGCEDSLVTDEAEIQQFTNVEHSIRAALQKLFVTEHSEWSNVFLGQDISMESVAVEGGLATIRIAGNLVSGGVCDDPRIEEQLRATATQFAGVDDVEILVNGDPWEPGQQ